MYPRTYSKNPRLGPQKTKNFYFLEFLKQLFVTIYAYGWYYGSLKRNEAAEDKPTTADKIPEDIKRNVVYNRHAPSYKWNIAQARPMSVSDVQRSLQS